MIENHRIPGALLVVLVSAACGGGDKGADAGVPAAEAPSAPTPVAADWIQVDVAANTVSMTVVAGQDATNNNWNFNGHANGNVTVAVPVGSTVTIEFSNNDARMGHSIGVSTRPSGPWSATPDATPVFAGAVSSNPTSMTESTVAGESETLTFTAGTVGEYALVCFVPGHATAGMWINFDVVPVGESTGVMTSM